MTDQKQTHFHKWKTGKHWVYGATVLTLLAGGVTTTTLLQPQWFTQLVHAATMPSDFTQVGSIGSAPLYQTSNTSWSNIQKGIDALTEGQTPDYYVGAVQTDSSGNITAGQKVGWYDGQTSYAGQSLGSLASANPADLTQPNYLFVKNAIMKNDGFTDSDNYNDVTAPGQYVGIHNVGQAFESSTGKYVPIGIKVTINDATYYDSSSATSPRDVFSDGYKLMVAARNDGKGNITLGYVVVMTGVQAVDNGGGSEGGGSGGGSGQTYGGCTLGIPDSVNTSITYVNEDTGQALSGNALSAVKIADIDAGQSATLDSGNLGYFISNPTNLVLKDGVLTANSDNTVTQDASTLDANSYVSLKSNNSYSLIFRDTLGNKLQGSIVESLFGTQGPSLTASGYIQLDKTTAQYGDDLPNNLYDFTDLKFQVINKDGKVMDTLTLDSSGKSPKSKPLPPGDYTLHEISDSWDKTGQTERPDVSVHITGGQTTTVSGDQLTNQAVQGQITIVKKGVESGTDLWNGNYSLAGNQFKITKLDGADKGKIYTITTDAKGEAKTDKTLALGKYHVEEIKASDGFALTFKPVDVELTYKDKTTQLVFDEADGTNQEIKGQNTLEKSDKATGSNQDGKAVMKTAQYALFHNDTSTGSSPHTPGQAVLWTEKPNPKLIAGDKVTTSIIGGNTVNWGDKVVVDIDDASLDAAVGNLAEGDYYWQEVNAPEGYVVDPTKHTFSIKKKDDATQNIVTDNVKSAEQVIKAKITLDKSVTLPDNSGGTDSQGGSGYNGVEFTATPMSGTKADPVTFKTGINPNTGDDGWAQQNLIYGDWKITETKGVEGYQNIDPIYIHMTTDTAKDELTISASHNEDFSKPFSTRTFNITDDSDQTNPNGDSSVGDVDSNVPTISLSTIHLNDNNPNTPQPSIDIEKANDAMPNAGDGNYTDQPNNAGVNDHDTAETYYTVKGTAKTPIFFKVTNNGTEDLTDLKVSDQTIEGKVDVSGITWSYNGQKLSTNKDGFLTTPDGKELVLKPKETITATGTLGTLPVDDEHGDEAAVTGVGVTSKKKVGDNDKWYGKRPKPSIDIEKSNDDYAKAGNGNNADKDNNAGTNDHDTASTADDTQPSSTPIFFHITNNGEEALTNLVFKDTTTDGKIDVSSLKFFYQSKDGKTKTDITIDAKSGYFVDASGKVVTLQVGDQIFGTGTLPELPVDQLHGDNATITGTGVISGDKVGDHDKWYGKRPKPSIDIEKASGAMPESGQGNNTDKADNLGNDKVKDADTQDSAVSLDGNVKTAINFRVTNNGVEDLTHVKVTDTTVSGNVSMSAIVWTYNGQKLTINKDGEFELSGKLFVLPAGKSITGTADLDKVPAGTLSGDKATVSGVGVKSGIKVGDSDSWYGKTLTPPQAVLGSLPHTGEGRGAALLSILGGLILGVVAYLKRSELLMRLRQLRRKFK